MELTKKQFAKIEHLMPVVRKPATISNYQFLCALLYITENGCKWRALPKKYGNWHLAYMKFSRWSKNGTIQKVFDEMQKMGLIKTNTDVLRMIVQASKSTWMPLVPGNQMGIRTLDVQRGLTTKLHLCCTSKRYAFAFHLSAGNHHDAPEGRRLIGDICSEENHPFLMDRA